MHAFKFSASPWLCELTLDTSLSFTAAHLNNFKRRAEQGISVVGHSPNILLKSQNDGFKESYAHWASLDKLFSVLHTGRIGVVSTLPLPEQEAWSQSYPHLQFATFEKLADAQQWLSGD